MSSSDKFTFPNRIGRLGELASDLWWSWNPAARDVFRRLDYTLWRQTNHNPMRMLRLVSAQRLEEATRNAAFLASYDTALESLDRARSGATTWCSRSHPPLADCLIAYFSAEFAVHQSLPLYAGGLGVLAGDHCKEASDLGVPLVGVGFRYPMGYFHQRISAEGWQQEIYSQFAVEETPLERATTPDGQPCTVLVPLGHGNIHVAVWVVRMGRVKLYLLDTDVEGNQPWERELSAKLYVSERDARLRQEIVLGIGGVRALRALGHDPTVWHLNEGHAAFVVLERIRELVEAGESVVAALAEVRATTAFTTHTPVAAGHDAFPFHLVDDQLAGFWETAGERRSTLLALAAYDNGGGRLFNMTALALRGSGAVNAVSQGHRDLTSRMFGPIWGEHEGVVQGVTNGVHLATWLAPTMESLFARYFGDGWEERHDNPSLWDKVLEIPDEELWNVRQLLKDHLLAFVRERARQRWTQDQSSAAQVVAGGTLLDPSVLTIGFARRFTEYKRPELIFQDPDRLARLLHASERPVQLVFAGKAHPADDPGKRSLQRIYQRAADPRFAGRIAFVDDYDLHVAHFLLQGCDVWLNNPREPLEACGTSGMKASMNGVPHLSVADGWWSEGYTGFNGWLIKPVDSGGDQAEAEALYSLLEGEVVPAFYERDEHGVPTRWLAIVKQAIRTVAPRFCARRMVKQYVDQIYLPLARSQQSRNHERDFAAEEAR